jgi:hypothetical protein
MLKIVALKVIAVLASFSKKSAVPNDAGRGPPPFAGLKVGVVGGFSDALFKVA